MAWPGLAKIGHCQGCAAWLDSPAWPDIALLGMGWPGLAWPGLLGLAWPGLAWPGLLGLAWL
eukprot:968378-Alexandrium_andersonii.AAC.1